MRRRKRIKHLNDVAKWRIERLATNGGFSISYIAEYALGTAQTDMSFAARHQRAAVASYLCRCNLRLTDWRRGATAIARVHAAAAVKKRKRHVA
jgi:hypothetical protein